MSTLVVDFHMHIYSGDDSRFDPQVAEWMESFGEFRRLIGRIGEFGNLSPEDMLDFMDLAGVDVGVVLADDSPMVTGGAPNEVVARFCEKSPRLVPFGTVNPHTTREVGREVARLGEELGMRGLKLLPSYQGYFANDPVMYPAYSEAERLGMPVVFHTGSSVFRGTRLKHATPILLDDVAVDFPDLVIIMAHSGRGIWYDEAFFLTRLHPNVYMEVSGLPPQNLLSYFPRIEEVADKVLFGSDWPGLPDLKGNIERVRSLPLPDKIKDKILGANGLRLLGLEETDALRRTG